MSKFIATAAGLAIAGVALADRPAGNLATSLVAPQFASSDRGIADLEENWEGFPVGPFDSLTSPSYTSSFDTLFSIVNPGIDGNSYEYAADGFGINDQMVSPVDPTPAQGFLGATYRADSIDNSYGFTPIAPAVGMDQFIVTRVLMETDGTIDVLQVDPADPANGIFVDTGFTWSAGEEFQIGVDLASDGTFRVLKNGAASASFTDISFELTGTVTPGYDSLVLDHFNQNEGPLVLVDNITGTVIPTPGAMALLGVAGLAATRRRR